jgi:hypothetical protein
MTDPSPEVALEQLEVANRELLAADTDDLSRLAAILECRGQAIAAIASASLRPEMASRLKRALEAGAEASHRLRLARAGAMARMEQCGRERHLLHALATPTQPRTRVNVSG